LEDRAKFITSKIMSHVKHTIDITTSKETIKSGEDKGKPYYIIRIKKKPQLDEYTKYFNELGAISEKNEWIINID
jgi:hypothetical protein